MIVSGVITETDYGVVVKSDLRELVKSVQFNIDNGWVPQGGISVAMDDQGDGVFVQAIVKINVSYGK